MKHAIDTNPEDLKMAPQPKRIASGLALYPTFNIKRELVYVSVPDSEPRLNVSPEVLDAVTFCRCGR